SFKIRQRFHIGRARHHPQNAPCRNIQQLQTRTTVVQIGGYVGGHCHDSWPTLKSEYPQLIRVTPQREFHLLRHISQCPRLCHHDQGKRNGGRRPRQGQNRQTDIGSQRW